MSDFIGNLCPVCESRFIEGDDIVVCPDCGTPYHRACWQKIGHCLHETEHAAGFEWKPDFTPEEAAAASVQSVCPNCGFHNEPGARICSHCGVAMPTAENDAPTYRPMSGVNGSKAPGDFSADDVTAAFTPHEVGPDDLVDGIKARDWASYVGKSSLFYLLQFIHMDENKRKTSICFSAFFFGPLYFFYRKMWKEGALFTLITLLLAVPGFISLMALAQVPMVSGISLDWLAPASWVCYALDCVQMLLRGIFAIYWYKKDAGKNIRAIYARHPADDSNRADALALRGGTSVVAAVLYLLAYFLLGLGLATLIGPDKFLAIVAMNR